MAPTIPTQPPGVFSETSTKTVHNPLPRLNVNIAETAYKSVLTFGLCLWGLPLVTSLLLCSQRNNNIGAIFLAVVLKKAKFL